MDTVFEALLFLAFALIAINITVFVLAVSLLGRAIKMSIQEQTEAAEKGKKETEAEIKKIQGKLEESKNKGHVDVDILRQNLKDLEQKQRKQKTKLYWIKMKPSMLRVGGGVLLPGVCFLISIFFSILARYDLSQNPEANVFGYCFGAVAFIFIGIYLIYQTLKVIEGVAITSEETAFVRQKEMFKSALLEIEEVKKPQLLFEWIKLKPPFHIKADSVIKLSFRTFLAKGDFAENAVVVFFIPKIFSFPGKETVIQEKDIPLISEYLTTRIDLEQPMIMGRAFLYDMVIKSSSDTGIFNSYYRLTCKGFYGELEKFEIIVE